MLPVQKQVPNAHYQITTSSYQIYSSSLQFCENCKNAKKNKKAYFLQQWLFFLSNSDFVKFGSSVDPKVLVFVIRKSFFCKSGCFPNVLIFVIMQSIVCKRGCFVHHGSKDACFRHQKADFLQKWLFFAKVVVFLIRKYTKIKYFLNVSVWSEFRLLLEIIKIVVSSYVL